MKSEPSRPDSKSSKIIRLLLSSNSSRSMRFWETFQLTKEFLFLLKSHNQLTLPVREGRWILRNIAREAAGERMKRHGRQSSWTWRKNSWNLWLETVWKRLNSFCITRWIIRSKFTNWSFNLMTNPLMTSMKISSEIWRKMTLSRMRLFNLWEDKLIGWNLSTSNKLKTFRGWIQK